MISVPLVKYILTAAVRDKLVITLGLMILLGSFLAYFLGSATTIENAQFSVVFAAGGLRFLGVLGLILFCCFHVRRSFENKEVEFLLSRPISRVSFLLSHAFAFMIIATVFAIIISFVVMMIGSPTLGGLIAWGGSIWVEFAVMASLALFFSMVVSSAAGAALACVGFYFLARMIGMLLGITNVPAESLIIDLLGSTLNILAIIIPRFDLFGQTDWLLYGISELESFEFMRNSTSFAQNMMGYLKMTGFIVAQGIFYIFLLISASIVDLLKKRF